MQFSWHSVDAGLEQKAQGLSSAEGSALKLIEPGFSTGVSSPAIYKLEIPCSCVGFPHMSTLEICINRAYKALAQANHSTYETGIS